MLAMHDQITGKTRNRLKTACIGLGLVRLLQDARRFEEAKTILYSLQDVFQGVAAEADKPSLKPCKAKRLNGVSRVVSCSSASASTRIDTTEILHGPACIA
jgi:hypothetical protein